MSFSSLNERFVWPSKEIKHLFYWIKEIALVSTAWFDCAIHE